MMPRADCSACFIPYCNSLARRVLLGVNELEECPLLMSGRGRSESLDPLRKATSEGVRHLDRRLVSLVGTKTVIKLPMQGGAKPFDVIDILRAREFMEGFLGGGQVRVLPELGVLRARIEGMIFTVTRDGRVLAGGGGAPGPSALNLLARLLWGSVSRRGPIIPEHWPDGARVRVGGV